MSDTPPDDRDAQWMALKKAFEYEPVSPEFCRFENAVPDDLAAGIGRVVVAWGEVEWVQRQVIGELLSQHGGARDVVALNLSNSETTATIRALLQVANVPELLKEWDAISKEITKLGIERNDLVHCAWFAREDFIDATRMRARRKLTITDLKHTEETLSKLHERIKQLSATILAFTLNAVDGRGAARLIAEAPAHRY